MADLRHYWTEISGTRYAARAPWLPGLSFDLMGRDWSVFTVPFDMSVAALALSGRQAPNPLPSPPSSYTSLMAVANPAVDYPTSGDYKGPVFRNVYVRFPDRWDADLKFSPSHRLKITIPLDIYTETDDATVTGFRSVLYDANYQYAVFADNTSAGQTEWVDNVGLIFVSGYEDQAVELTLADGGESNYTEIDLIYASGVFPTGLQTLRIGLDFRYVDSQPWRIGSLATNYYQRPFPIDKLRFSRTSGIMSDCRIAVYTSNPNDLLGLPQGTAGSESQGTSTQGSTTVNNTVTQTGVTAHSLLTGLDYASAGHTGFVPDTLAIYTVSGLFGSGTLTGDLTLGIDLAALDVRYIGGTGTSGTLPVFNSASGLTNSIVAQVDLGTNYAISITDLYTGAVATLVPDYYSLGLSRLYALPPVNAGFGCFLVGSQNSGITGRVPYYSEAALIDNSEWKFSTTSLLSGIDLQAISGIFEKLSVRGQDTDSRYALSGTAGGGGASVLDDLTDVTLATPTSGQILAYDGAEWVNFNQAGGGDITGTGTSGQLAIFDANKNLVSINGDVRYALSGTGGGSSPTYTINASGQIDVRVILASGVIPNGGTASTIIWSGISQAYDYLEVRGMMRSNAATTVVHVAMYLNNDTTDGNYLTRRIEADSSAFTAAAYDAPFVGIGQALQQLNTDGGDVSPLHFIIPAYSQAGHRKRAYTVGPVAHNFSDTNTAMGLYTMEWENTSGPAVNMIELQCANAVTTFTSGTELYLIGVRKQWAVTSGSYGSMNIVNGVIVP